MTNKLPKNLEDRFMHAYGAVHVGVDGEYGNPDSISEVTKDEALSIADSFLVDMYKWLYDKESK